MPALRIDKTAFSYRPLGNKPINTARAISETVPEGTLDVTPAKNPEKAQIIYPTTSSERTIYRTDQGKAVTAHQWDVYDFVRSIPCGRVTTYKDVCLSVGGSPRSDLHAKLENSSPDSQTTASSKQTSSDKLSALPTSKSTPNANRALRSPVATSSNILPNRGYRRSLDASISLPSFSTADLDSPPLNSVWNATHNLNTHLNAGGTAPRGTSADGSGTPRQRVSFDSDRGSLPTMQSVRQAFSRMNRGSDPAVTSPAQRSSAYRDSQKDPDSDAGSRSPSHSRSRAASPLRLFQQWSAGRHRHRHPDPFVPIDPFKFKTHFRFPRFPTLTDPLTPKIHTHSHNDPGSPDIAGCEACMPTSAMKDSWSNARIFLLDTLPRQVYLNILLRLPAMYFSRVAKIFEDAEVSRPDIQRMIESGGGGSGFLATSASEQITVGTLDSANNHGRSEYPPGTLSPTMAAGIGLTTHVGVSAASAPQMPLPFPDEWTAPLVSPALIRFKNSWEAFIDSLLREWKTLNVVSALLSSAILTIFQIPSAADDPVTRTAALLSLICALMSLSYGCMYIVRFGTMRSMYRASKWAEFDDDSEILKEARKTDTLIWWNVWVLLAMPGVWMSWSMIFFIASILSFVWRTGSEHDPEQRPPLTVRAALGPRIAITGTFVVGMVYLALIVKTLRSYGTHAGGGTAWRRKTQEPEHPHPQTQTQAQAQVQAQTPDLRARDVDAAMERRGRERQRSTSGRRRREETPEEGRGAHAEVFKEERRDNRGVLRSFLGLGIVGVGSREQDSGMHLDLEKGEERGN
ncbi:hypothetical protein D9615_009585 [Tricholomella constricta]|uniref:Uncharacterized protein n=1 Tax=Tricholomella constricta TaxID=117010 RepID=A0A8H5GUH4_9AGAR|nr:hypothetical protein D9615_009585 [Tricholomella constricta]